MCQHIYLASSSLLHLTFEQVSSWLENTLPQKISWYNNNSIKFIFTSWWNLLITCTLDVSLDFTHLTSIQLMCDILVDLSFSWIIDLRYLKLHLLEMTCVSILTTTSVSWVKSLNPYLIPAHCSSSSAHTFINSILHSIL